MSHKHLPLQSLITMQAREVCRKAEAGTKECAAEVARRMKTFEEVVKNQRTWYGAPKYRSVKDLENDPAVKEAFTEFMAPINRVLCVLNHLRDAAKHVMQTEEPTTNPVMYITVEDFSYLKDL